jgi:hypothetical protein|tara:strand:- start:108 stop:392 length:285 start_codon:yes stop_codon:yes gene_type:complete
MATPIDLKTLTESERTLLVQGIPLLRDDDPYYWEKKDFKDLYQKWLVETGAEYAEGGFAQFKLAVAYMKRRVPLTYKTGDIYVQKKEYGLRDVK